MDELLTLAVKTQENMQDEATAIKGYTETASLIAKVREAHPELDELERMNDEIIADELAHQQILHKMYTMITGILPKEE